MLDTVPAVLLWAVTLWRAPSARQSPAKRSLWIAFLSLAVAMTVRPVAISTSTDDLLGVNNVSFLIKHLCGIAAASSVLSFVNDMSEEKNERLQASRLHIAIPIGTAAAITVLFFLTPQPVEVNDLLADYADDGRIAAYGVIWTAYLGAALFSGTRLCWQWGRQPGTGLLGRGLRVTGIGTAIGIV